MTHLRIEQNNGVIEEVSSEVIKKLYNIVHNGTLDNTSNLVGRLHTSATYQDYIDYLEDTFKVNGVKQLIIDSTNIYIHFNDPVVESYWANSVGDGVGVTTIQALNVTNMPQNVFNNTTVTSFNELVQFGITSLPSNCFNGATNLTSINTSKITDFGDSCFNNSGITSIDLSSCNYYVGESAFNGCASLQSVIWPERSFNMYKSAFQGCTSLQSVDLTYLNNSNANYAIRQSCFGGCTSLTSVIIGTNVKAIDAWAFSNCQSLSSINLSGIETISSSFDGCSSLTSIDLSSCITIGSEAFNRCTSLTSIDLSSCTSIGKEAFKNCTSLTTITLGSNITLGSYVFAGCTSLTTINNTHYITQMGSTNDYGPFNNNDTPFSSLVINNPNFSGVTTTGTYAFKGLSGLTGTLILGTITNMRSDSQLFKGCSGLTKIVIGSIPSLSSSYTNWQNSSLSNCNNLQVLDIGNITKFTLSRSSLITHSTNFKALILRQTTPPTIEIANGNAALTVGFNQFVISDLTPAYSQAKIYVPDAAISNYASAQHWSNLYNDGYILPLSSYVES